MASYQVTDYGKNICFHRERDYDELSKYRGGLAIYDNLGGETKLRSGPIVRSILENFVSAEIIKCDIPIRIGLHYSVNPENDLANLLYADLKLRKLYEAYQTLQKRTAEILEGLSVPYTERITENDRFIRHGSSIFIEKEAIDRGHQSVRGCYDVFEDITPKVAISQGGDNFFLSNLKHQQGSEWVTMAASRRTNFNTEAGDNTYSVSHNKEGKNNSQSNSVAEKKKRSLIPDKSGMPWILRIFIKLQEYMFANPRDLILSILIFALVLSFILSAKKR